MYQVSEYTLGTVLYRASEFGLAASYDTLATGSIAIGQTFEAADAASAQSYIVGNSGDEARAEGIGFYIASDLWYEIYLILRTVF